MKKKIVLILLIMIGLFIITGCKNKPSNSQQVNSQKESIDEYLKTNNYVEIDFICDEEVIDSITHFHYLSVIKDTESFFVTNSEEIYKLYNGKKYSNDKNCIKTEKNEKNYIYFSLRDNLKTVYPNASDVYITGNVGHTFVLINNIPYLVDDALYKMKKEVKINLEKNETIIGFYGSYDYPMIKTNKKYYYFSKHTINNCEEYAECEFEYFFEEDKFSKFYDLSKYYDGHIILTKDNKLFSRDAV